MNFFDLRKRGSWMHFVHSISMTPTLIAMVEVIFWLLSGGFLALFIHRHGGLLAAMGSLAFGLVPALLLCWLIDRCRQAR